MSRNITQPSQQVNGKENEKQSMVYQDDITTNVFIKVLVIETLARNRLNSHFINLRWKNVMKAFNNLIEKKKINISNLRINGVLLKRIDNFAIP